MLEAADVLSYPSVRNRLRAVIAAAAAGYGVKGQHAEEMASRFVAPICEGAPVESAVALVDEILNVCDGNPSSVSDEAPHA